MYIYIMIVKLDNRLNNTAEQKTTATRVIREIFAGRKLSVRKIIFFGSRARGDYHKDSDWDFLVVSDQELPVKDRHRIITHIKRQLAKLGIPNDILIQSTNKFDTLKNYPGNISYVANLEGVAV